MNVLLGILILLTSTVYADENKCDALRQDLIALEYKRQTSKMDKCATTQDLNCRPDDGSIPKLQKTLLEVELEYNKAVSDLVLLEGFATMGKVIEDSHNSLDERLNLVNNANIKEAQEHLKTLKRSLSKADLMHAILEPAGGTSKTSAPFWSSYKGESLEELKVYIDKSCNSKKEESFIILCKRLGNRHFSDQASVSKDNYIEDMQTVHGFLMADKINIQNDEQVVNRYKEYLASLKITANGKQYSSKKFQADMIDNKSGILYRVEQAMTAFEISKSKENASRLIDLSKELDVIAVSYDFKENHISGSSNNNYSRVEAEFQNRLQKPLTDLNLSKIFITDSAGDSLHKHTEIYENEFNLKDAALKDEVKKFLTGPINANCINKGVYQCLKEKCNFDGNNACQDGGNHQNQLSELYKKYQVIKDHEKIKNSLKAATSCVRTVIDKQGNRTSPPPTLKEKQKCMDDQKKLIPQLQNTNIAKLRKEIQEKQALLEEYNNSQPFKSLNLAKGLAFQGLNSHFCNKTDKMTKLETHSSICGAPEISNYNYEALSLLDAGQDIFIKINQGLVAQASKSSHLTGDLKVYREQLKTDCRLGIVKSPTLCAHHADNQVASEDYEKKKEAATERLRLGGPMNPIPIDYEAVYNNDDPNLYAEFGKGLGMGLLNEAPNLFGMYFQDQAARDQSRSQVGYYNSVTDYNNNNPRYNYSSYGPWGTGYNQPPYHTNIQSTMSFQAPTINSNLYNLGVTDFTFGSTQSNISPNTSTIQTNSSGASSGAYSFSF